MKNKVVFAVVITYKPNIDSLIHSLNLLNQQVERVVIVNNSCEHLNLNFNFLHIIELNDNYGIAYAQNVGMHWAFDNGATFVLQMDQDSIILPNTVCELLSCYNELTSKGFKVGLVGCQDFDKDTKKVNIARLNKGKSIKNTNFYSVLDTLSSGSLIHKDVFIQVGDLQCELFIDSVDWEYCWRLRKFGFLVIIDTDAKLAHKLGNGEEKHGIFTLRIPAPFRHYYQYRNFLILFCYKYAPIYWRLSTLIRYLGKIVIYPFALRDWKERYKYIFWGVCDGFFNRWGRLDHTIKRSKRNKMNYKKSITT